MEPTFSPFGPDPSPFWEVPLGVEGFFWGKGRHGGGDGGMFFFFSLLSEVMFDVFFGGLEKNIGKKWMQKWGRGQIEGLT